MNQHSHMLENAPKTVKAKVNSFAVSNAISSAKSSNIFAGQKHWKSSVDKYRSFNAVVESFFGVLKRDRVNRVLYRTREEARADLFEYIEVFYNQKRRYGYLGNVSPADFEMRSGGSFETVH